MFNKKMKKGKKVHVLTLHLKMTSQPHIDGVSPLRTVSPKKKIKKKATDKPNKAKTRLFFTGKVRGFSKTLVRLQQKFTIQRLPVVIRHKH